MSRGSQRLHLALAVLLAASSFSVAETGNGRSLPVSWLDDADLTDVFFLDPDRGWAVGDRGVIWSTSDGGRRWQLQASGVTCRLESIHFVDRQNGWIVGGRSRPYSPHSIGVVLRTTDGGRHWSLVSRLQLPWLRKVCFFDQKHGVAVGDSTAMYPTGLFRTHDGGQTWVAAAGATANEWLAGDFAFDGSGVLVAADQTAVIDGSRRPMQIFRRKPLGLRQVRNVESTLAGVSWLVGDGGAIRISRDGGATWKEPQDRTRHAARSQIDFRAVATAGRGCWVAGAPGSIVLHSSDEGKSWSAALTGQTAPIHALFFLSQDRGWAVGAMGTILATRDGGRTWRSQRPARRAALMAVFAEPKDVPFELLAQLSGNEGYRSVVEILTRRDLETETLSLAGSTRKVHQAVSLSGGSSASVSWRFQKRGLTPFSGAAQKDLEEHLVRQIRIWRPDVIVTHSAENRGEDALGPSIQRAIVDAIEKAADPQQYAAQISVGGLRPWRVKRVFASSKETESSDVILVPAQFGPRLGRSLASQAAMARAVLNDRFQPSPPRLAFRALLSAQSNTAKRQQWFDGLVLTPGGAARRVSGSLPAASLSALKRSAQRQQMIEQLLSSDSSPQTAVALLGQIDELTKDMEADSATGILFQLAWSYSEDLRFDLAAEVLHLLVRRYPDHDLAPPSLSWLVTYLGSAEAAWQVDRLGLSHFPGVASLAVGRQSQHRVVSGTIDFADYVENRRGPAHFAESSEQNVPVPLASEGLRIGSKKEGYGSQLPRPEHRTVSAQQNQSVGYEIALGQRAQQANELIKWMHQRWPTLYAEPPPRFVEAAAWRNQQQSGLAERATRAFSARQRRDAWADCARGEMWLRQPRGKSPKPMATCKLGTTKPVLDGRFDDQIWQSARPLRLSAPTPRGPKNLSENLPKRGGQAHFAPKTPQNEPVPGGFRIGSNSATLVMLARDSEYLYLAVRCQKAAGANYPVAKQTRHRDPDLTQRDRVDLYLDLDRDYATYYHLTVDHRGWVADSFWAVSGWNPQWYVASTDAKGQWTAEAAIPLAELAAKPPSRRDVWAIGIQRTIPNVGFQSWSWPAEREPRPEGFGYLSFD